MGGLTGDATRVERPLSESVAPRGVLATLCVTVTLSYGILYYAFAVLAPDIARDTGWSLTEITAAFSSAGLMSGAAGIVVGRVIQARGPRGPMVGGGLVGAVGLSALAAAPTYSWFLAAMLLCGVGAAGLFYPPAFAAITHWYGSRRVEALTALTLVAGFASTIFAPLTNALAEHASWRQVYLIYAVALVVVAVPGHLLTLRLPWRIDSHHERHGRDRMVATSPTFVLTALGGMLTTLAMYASIIALIPLFIERGASPRLAAVALGLGGAGQVLGRLMYPWLAARVGLHRRVALVSGGVAVTIVAFPLVSGPAGVVAAVLAGAARGLFTLVQATLVTDIWGAHRYAALNGALGAPIAFAAAAGPFAGAWIAGVAGGYPLAFAVFALIAATGAFALSLAAAKASGGELHPR